MEAIIMILAENSKYRIGGYQAGEKPADTKHHSAERFEEKQLPPKVDLRQYMTEVEKQVGNSCVANAFVGAYEYLAKRSLGDSADVSRLFVYYNARLQDSSQQEDRGTTMFCAIKSLVEHGACSEDIWPNDENLICSQPDTNAYEQAANFKITDCEFIETDLNLWRHTLAEGYPIAFALNTFNSFDESTRNKGRVPMPKESDNVRETHGWHAMLCVGYSDKDRMFIVRNSWGSEWADKGYCYIPYDYVIHPDYNARDSWIIKALSDTDFSAGVWEDDESFFAGEGELFLYDFYINTSEPDNFIEALDSLCQEYVESEEDYYFDYDEDENNSIVNILNFDIAIEDSEDFLEKLEALCQEYAIDEDYSFTLEGEEDKEEEEDATYLYNFYINTAEPDNFIEQLNVLCQEYIESEEDYYFEPEQENNDGNFIVNILDFYIAIDDSEEFLSKLESLCEEYAIDEDYSFSLEDEDDDN